MTRDSVAAVLAVGLDAQAAVRKKGYVSGVARQSFLDKKTGFRDPGFGLDIVDFILEPGKQTAEPEKLDPHLRYSFNNLVHGKRKKQFIGAHRLPPKVVNHKRTAITFQLQGRLVVFGDGIEFQIKIREF